MNTNKLVADTNKDTIISLIKAGNCVLVMTDTVLDVCDNSFLLINKDGSMSFIHKGIYVPGYVNALESIDLLIASMKHEYGGHAYSYCELKSFTTYSDLIHWVDNDLMVSIRNSK